MTQLKFVVEGLSGTQGRSGELAECGVIGIRAENKARRLVYDAGFKSEYFCKTRYLCLVIILSFV